MRIDAIWIEQHRRLRDCAIQLPGHSAGQEILSPLFENMILTVLAGNNGAGKTSLMSFLAQVFHNLPRFPERIVGAFRIEYTLRRHAAPVRVVLDRKTTDARSAVYIELPETIPRTLIVPQRPNASRTVTSPGTICYDRIRDWLPRTIVVSAFSLHGEYPGRRPPSYLGDRPVNIYDTSNIYGRNHYQMPSLSTGIRRLMDLVSAQGDEVGMLEELFGAHFTGRVAWRQRYPNSEGDQWSTYNLQLSSRELSKEIWLNDFELEGPGHAISLGNMSSGQKMLFVRLLSILSEIDHDALIIMEEPELHLDPAWTAQLASLLTAMFRKFRSHFLVASHSYSVINSVPSSNLLRVQQGSIAPVTRPTLLANEPDIAWSLYEAKPNVVETFLEAAVAAASTEAELEEIVSLLGESALRVRAWKRLRSLRSQ